MIAIQIQSKLRFELELEVEHELNLKFDFYLNAEVVLGLPQGLNFLVYVGE